MAVKAVNFKMEEHEIADLRHMANVYRMTLTDFIKEAISEHLVRTKEDPYYRLTANVEEADAIESAEILSAIDELKPDDLAIIKVEHVSV